VLIEKREKALEEAKSIGSNVWDFVVRSQQFAASKTTDKVTLPLMDHYFIIAKDEAELESRISIMEIMST
jgi:hypothetical protein